MVRAKVSVKVRVRVRVKVRIRVVVRVKVKVRVRAGRVRGRWVEGDTDATEKRLGTCQRGLGLFKDVRAVRPVNDPLLMTMIWLPPKPLRKRMSKHGDTRMMR